MTWPPEPREDNVKKDVVVIPARGPIEVPIVIRGTDKPMLDEDGRQLIIMGEEGNYITFNWDNVLYFGVTDHEHDEECEANTNG